MGKIQKQICVDFTELPKLTNSVYLPCYLNMSRYLVLYGGAGSGKSRFVAQKIVYRMLTETQHRFLVARKIEKSLRKSAHQLLIDTIEDMGLEKLFKYSKSPTGEMTISCLNGNTILFVGLDSTEKLKSIEKISGVWIEEASELSLDDFTQLDLRLRGKLKNYKQIILSFNPINSKHWLKKRFFDIKDKDATVIHTTYLDNKFLDETYITVLNTLKVTNFSYYEIYALGKWGVLKGKIYKEYTIIDEMPTDAEIHRWGQDFGFNNPSATTEVMINGNNLYLDELLFETQLTNTQLMHKLKTQYPHIMKIKGFLDSAEPARIADFKKAGFDVLPALKDVKAGIDKVMTYNIHVTKRSLNIINELDLYVWKLDRNDEPLDEPLKEHDHALDAVRYAVFTDNKEPTVMQVIKRPSILG